MGIALPHDHRVLAGDRVTRSAPARRTMSADPKRFRFSRGDLHSCSGQACTIAPLPLVAFLQPFEAAFQRQTRQRFQLVKPCESTETSFPSWHVFCCLEVRDAEL